jgi:hypothetical protein
MGLKSAVIVVAGWEAWDEETDEADAEGSAEVEEDSVGGWNEGGVASGSVVKRMPVDTVKNNRLAFLRRGKNVDGRRRHNLLRSSLWR